MGVNRTVTMNAPTTNAAIARLQKIERRAQKLAEMKDANERAWEAAYEKAKATPEWNAMCESTGIVKHYNYGDIIA